MVKPRNNTVHFALIMSYTLKGVLCGELSTFHIQATGKTHVDTSLLSSFLIAGQPPVMLPADVMHYELKLTMHTSIKANILQIPVVAKLGTHNPQQL